MNTGKNTVLLSLLGVFFAAILIPAAIMAEGIWRFVAIGIMLIYIAIMSAVLGTIARASKPIEKE